MDWKTRTKVRWRHGQEVSEEIIEASRPVRAPSSEGAIRRALDAGLIPAIPHPFVLEATGVKVVEAVYEAEDEDGKVYIVPPPRGEDESPQRGGLHTLLRWGNRTMVGWG